MLRMSLVAGLALWGVTALAQPPRPIFTNAFPGAFGLAVGQPIDPARMRALGFVAEDRHGPTIWVRRRPGEFYAMVEVQQLTTGIIIAIEGIATFSRPAGTPDTPESRVRLMALCRPAVGATAGAWFAGFPREIDTQTAVYISERVDRRGVTELGSQTASLMCTQDEPTGDIHFSLLLTRLPRPGS